MMAYDSMSYWDIYELPVPIRKWLITRHNKYTTDQGKTNGQSMDEPLSPAERLKMIKNSTQSAQVAPNPSNFLGPQRNQ